MFLLPLLAGLLGGGDTSSLGSLTTLAPLLSLFTSLS